MYVCMYGGWLSPIFMKANRLYYICTDTCLYENENVLNMTFPYYLIPTYSERSEYNCIISNQESNIETHNPLVGIYK